MFISPGHSTQHLSWREGARPQIALSGVVNGVSVVLCVPVDVPSHVAVFGSPPPFTSGVGTGNGRVNCSTITEI